jgi:outer membrane protein insertion porin family
MSCFPRLPRHGLAGLLLLFVLAAVPVHAQGTRVTAIEVQGNQNINRETILTAINTREGDEASPERLERDRLAIEALGWFRSVALATQPVGDGVRVVFAVNEFPIVREIRLSGSTLYRDEQLRAAIRSQVGQVFNRVNWDEDLNSISKLYTDKGYQVRLVQNADPTQPDPDFLDRGIVKLEIHELKVGSVKIKWPTREKKDRKGNVVATVESHKTKNYVVMRELSQKPPALYNVQDIGKDYRALNNLQFFETINPSVEPGQEVDTVAITWELTEKRTGQISVGAGYSPRQQLIGQVQVSDQNFQGSGRSLSLMGEIGTFGGDGAPSVELQFYEPWLTKDRTSLTVNVYNKLVYRFSRSLIADREDRNRYFERRLGGQIAVGRPFKLPVTVGLRYDDVDTGELPRGADFPQQDGQVIAGNVRRIWNTRDYPQNPTAGNYLSVATEVGHASLEKSRTSNFTTGAFSKVIVDGRKYVRLRGLTATKEPEREQEAQKVPVVAFRAMFGAVGGDVPFFEQFFIGGADTLRGYLEDRFWGKYMYVGSIEYRRPLVNRIVGVAFVDVGDAFGSDSIFRFRDGNLRRRFEQHRDIRPFAAIGLGLRVSTPIGPIRLDFGYGEEGGRTHFSIGHAF